MDEDDGMEAIRGVMFMLAVVVGVPLAIWGALQLWKWFIRWAMSC
jgi:hypothetical protein